MRKHNVRKCSSSFAQYPSIKTISVFPFQGLLQTKPAVVTSRGQACTALRVPCARGHEPTLILLHRTEPGAREPGSESIHMEGVSAAVASVCVLFLKTRSSADA